jgi:hypothetical protein
MDVSSKKRTLDSFLAPDRKRARPAGGPNNEVVAGVGTMTSHDAVGPKFQARGHSLRSLSEHPTYPFLIPHLPLLISSHLNSLPSTVGQAVNDQPDLDLVYFQPYIQKYLERHFFEFL